MSAKTKIGAGFLLGCLLLAAGCAHDVARHGATLIHSAARTSTGMIALERDADITLDTGYQRRLARGSRWTLIGALPQGQVYRIADGAFTVEGAHVHEAYLVLDGNALAGFYLPVEKAFAPLATRPRLDFKPVNP